MSRGGTNAMRRRLLGAAVGDSREQGIEVEGGFYGIITPQQMRSKAESIDAFVRAVGNDILSHRAQLDDNFMAAWEGFVHSWNARFQEIHDSYLARMWFGNYTLLLESEATARRFRKSYEERTGLSSSVPDAVVTPRPGLPDFVPFAMPTAIIVTVAAVGGAILLLKLK